MKGYLVRLFSFVALIALAAAMLPANAGGVTVSYGSPADGEIDTADLGADGFATTTFTWNASGAYLTGDTITVVVSPAPSSTAVAACTPAPATAFGGTGSLGGFSSTGATWTFSGDSAGGNGGLCLRLPVAMAGGTATTTNISIAILSSGSFVDYGALLYYLGGGNDVTVTATVPSTLSFVIVDKDDYTTPVNTCALGSLTTGLVSTCGYRLKISTNAASGFSSTIESNHGLSSPEYATITAIAEDGTVTAGTEGYGIAVTEATYGGRDSATGLFNQPASATAPFNDDDTPVPTGATTFITYTDGFWSTSSAMSTSLVTHRAAISPVTPAGSYSQVVTYRVTGTF